ncbi:MAG TPA: AMP-binding protein [Burkholderiales bacterium]
MTEKIWLASYPPGVPAEVDTGRYRSLKHMFEHSCARYRDLPAISNLGCTLSYGDLDRESRRFAAYLQTGLGLAKGDRVAIMLPNVLQYPVAFFGAARAGLVLVNVNPLYTPRELQHQVADSGARTILILENFAHKLAEVIGSTGLKNVITTAVGDLLPAPRRWLVNFAVRHVRHLVPPWTIPQAISLRAALSQGERYGLKEVDVGPGDLALLQYTGGTTGIPKGAMLSHGNLVANLTQIAAWIGKDLAEGAEAVVTPLPLYHVFSLTANLLTFVSLGGHNLLVTDPRDIAGLIALLKQGKFTAITGVNTLFNALVNAPDFSSVDFSHVKVVVGGGAAIQQAVATRWKEVTGTTIIEGYGLTETSPVVCVNPLNIDSYTGMLGLPLPSTDVKICDEQGAEAATGEVGEICVKGPQVMHGYWNRPDETAKVLMPGGWLHTGDEGTMRADGYIKLSDRKKDIILVSGFKVFPNEVEEVAMMLPGVLEAGATAVADERAGQAVKLFIVRRDPALTAEQVLAHCRRNLTGYKVPKHVEFRTELPKSAIGKVLRRELH